MYSLWIAAIIGIIEGLTEFLPVSSTGHMILAQSLLGVNEDEPLMKTFTIVIQLGAILAVVIVYWRRILRIIGIDREPVAVKAGESRLSLVHILLGIVPAMLIAFLFDDLIETYLFSPHTVVVSLILGGILMIVAEKKMDRNTAPVVEDMDGISLRQALLIGLYQCLAVLIPGFSRSGATMAGGMLHGVSRKAGADFTFIMAVPIMFAASSYSLLKSYKNFTADDILFFLTGFVVSFLVALLAIVTFIRFVQRMKLTYFSYYRFALATIFIVYLYII
ncbi:undecaprenyl-diphosphate phosphatase [Paenibacillus lutrae]|uniref:Undecaprenyl-diphosphatase n=1 Tax=Paenibacillus lutrae TaxID=2078573 RepID=A0A7X3FJI8_9BACL|nr:undecaprenyl-diphosphate phosphatase [Paenibacillus lutrae]MVP00851.1 undecaprenyl-diphosphate phosphatase [Paenibacillus lutrae]